MKYRAQLLTFALFLFTVAMADEPKDTAFNNLYQRYFLLYTDTNEVAFYDVSNQLKEHYLKANNMDSYYKVWLNEVLYDTKMQKTFRAIKKCNSMLKEMEEKNDKHFCIVYSALGNIYDMRGNYRMSNKYYQQALKSCEPTDTGAIIGIYSRIASLQAHREPQKAKEVNEHFGKMTQHFPQYWKVYVVQKAEIAFYLDDRQLFDEAYKQYIAIRQEHPVLDAFGKDMMDVVYASFHGDYNRALELLNHESTDYDPLDCCDMRIHIFELMGRDDLALNEVTVRRDMRDSLNSDMLYDNMNEINAEMGLFQVKEEALQKEQENTRRNNMMLMITILLLLVALGLVISRNLMRRRLQKQLMTKNKQLEVALMRAEESDRMKDSFIEHVSHEIRTPLNIITGFTQVITNPTFKLKDDERDKMLNDININTIEITNIVNEMLDIAQDDSRQYYEKKDEVQVNQLCKDAIKDVEILNKHHLEIHLVSELADDYTIHTNRKAVMKVLKQLLDNGLKFTDEGGLEIHVDEMAEEGMVRFVITDTGIGIAKEHQEHIFKRFYKVDNFKQGFGLGLTLCLKTALLLGGNLSLDKDYTDGARFIFTLPTA
jgi:signal transduction histidine kinase